MNVSDLSKIKELRYITVEHLPGHMNMAIDEALSLCLGEKRDYVYLRLYCWCPSCLTFGYNQRISTILNFEEADSAGIDYVRRISGGKMVYHNDEYTFSLGFPVEFLKYRLGAATFIEMFKYAVGPLVKALCKSGVPARFSSPHEMSSDSVNKIHCYAAAAGHSIFADDCKLVGAAGFFKNECLVIHGSIPIVSAFPPDGVFLKKNTAVDNVKMASLSAYLTRPKIADLPDLIADTYSDSLELKINKLTTEELKPEEKTLAENLSKDKYQNLVWTKIK